MKRPLIPKPVDLYASHAELRYPSKRTVLAGGSQQAIDFVPLPRAMDENGFLPLRSRLHAQHGNYTELINRKPVGRSWRLAMTQGDSG